MSWSVPKKRQTKRIEGPNGEYIIIQKLSQGDKDDLMDLLATMDVAGKTEKQLANMNIGKMRHFQRERSIKEWNLKFDDGSAVPLTKESIRDLPQEIIQELDAAIEELNPEKLSEDKKK
jgi:hypothetical protein